MNPVNIVDKSNMRQVILDFPKQFRAGIFAAEDIRIPKRPLRSPVVICGMGGSALVGDILKCWMRHEYLGASEFELIVHRGYGIPKLERRDYSDGVWEPLIIASSYSGNTEETISAYKAARAKSLPIVAMGAGGKLKEFARKDGVPFIQIPPTGIQPRSSIGYQFGALATLLLHLDVLSFSLDVVANLYGTLRPEKLEKCGRETAKKILGATPLLYASDAWRELALTAKIKFNEHAKLPAFWNFFPELNHNEMTSYAELKRDAKRGAAKKFHLIIFEDVKDHPRTKKRMRLTAILLKKLGIGATFVPIEGKTVLEKFFNAYLLGDWMAYYAAVLRGVDPEPVALVEKFKKLMK